MEETLGTIGDNNLEAKTEYKKLKSTKRAKALDDAQCESCKKYGWDEAELVNKIISLSANHNVNQIASMLRVHSQYVNEVLKTK